MDGLDELDGGIGSNAFLGLKLLFCCCWNSISQKQILQLRNAVNARVSIQNLRPVNIQD